MDIFTFLVKLGFKLAIFSGKTMAQNGVSLFRCFGMVMAENGIFS